ncbi:MAG TPA: flagellar assembly peptidoglycan hydrolase FlgJ [Rhodocyclaceae bacterium]|nr:flagellar assembly peptidoglycan hydrolase FlgJ [Rhodocyclaceae bacterium]
MNPSAVRASVFDVNSLTALRAQAKNNDPQALKAAAQQFEAVFLQMVLKSMRDATPHEGLFESEQTRMYESLLDQQLAQVLSAKGGTGLAEMIEKQLAKSPAEPVPNEGGLPLHKPEQPYPLGVPAQALPLPSQTPQSFPLNPDGRQSSAAEPALDGTARDFVARVWPHALEASKATGIPASFLVAHAALETGWGRAEPHLADGRPSHNLFGIKAGRSWAGPTAEALTTEYVGGQPQRQAERFRAYGSYAESFRDYANLLVSSPRYAGVVGVRDAAGFARGLQKAGFATDPAYAAKLERIISGPLLRATESA